MATENITNLGGDVAPALKKGIMSVGEIVRISKGTASDFMTAEQVQARKVNPEREFIEMEIAEPETGTIFTKTFPFYGEPIPANSIQGGLVSMYGEKLCEGGEINLITKEVGGRDGNPFVVWDIVS